MSKSNALGVTFTLLILVAAWVIAVLHLREIQKELLRCFEEQLKDVVHLETTPP